MTNQSQVSPLVLTNKRGMRFLVTPDSRVLGRAPSADFIVDCTSVSRAHAKICLEMDAGERQVVIEDLGSLNGTFISETRITSGRVGIGEQVRFGNIAFTVQDPQHLDDESTISGQSIGQEVKDLSPAQQRVLLELLEGCSEKDVAAKLKLSPHTIHNHIREIYTRFNVHSRAELMAKCFLDKESGKPTFR